MTQLALTKQYDDVFSTEYYKKPLLISQVGSATHVTEILPARTAPVFVSFALVDLIRQSESDKESSISVRTIGDIELLGRFYTLHNPIEVKRLLLTHDYLISPLFEIYKHVKQTFGENIAEVCLEYDKDPEEDFEGLAAIVKTNLSPESSLDFLDKFDNEWWLDVDDEIRTLLTVMVRPV